MAFDGMMLSAVAAELRAVAVGARVSRVTQPHRYELVLALYKPRQELRLLISAHPQHARLHLSRATRVNPPAPPAFCMLLRKHLEGARLVDVVQPGWERLCRLRFQTVDELGAPAVYELVAETMGKYSNVVLVDAAGRVLDALRRAGPDTNPDRPVWPGFRYEPPAAQAKLDPGTPDLAVELVARLRVPAPDAPADRGKTSGAARWLQQQVAGISPLLAAEALARAGLDRDATPAMVPERAWQDVAETLRGWADDLPGGRSACTAASAADGKLLGFHAVELRQFGQAAAVVSYPSPSELLDTVFEALVAAEAVRTVHERLVAAVNGERARAARKLDLQESALREAANADDLRRCGELLTAHLHAIPVGAKAARVIDWYDPLQPKIEIPLDPTLSANVNAQRYFRRYQRARNTLVAAAEQAAKTRDLLRYLDEVDAAVERAGNVADLGEIEAELRAERILPPSPPPVGKKRVGEPAPAPPLRFRTSDGLEVLIGRNNRQNDWLSLRQARSDDIWLHTKDIAGTHALLRLPTAGEPPERSLREAAELAALHSKARRSSQVPVDYTRARYVRKPAGARPGMVVYDHHRTLYVTPDPGLAERLRD